MKKLPSKVTLIASMLATAGMFITPVLRAADEMPDKAPKAEAKPHKAKEPKVTEEVLKKYDKNSNGKLDPDEEAAWKADLAKARAEKKKKKDGN
jgi:hypothetical protein